MSKSQVSELIQELNQSVTEFRQRPLTSGPYKYMWVDALVHKCREGGRMANVATVIPTGVDSEGNREILGVDVFSSENGAAWLGFLRGLVTRGLSGIEFIISDCHAGLRAAVANIFPGSSWQRCRTHFARNLLTRVPAKAQDFVATMLRSAFSQPDGDVTKAQFNQVVGHLHEAGSRAAAELLEGAEPDILAFTAFPKQHWR